MLYLTKTIALQLESCIKQTHIEITKQYPYGKVLEINGGAACFSGFDSYLSQVVGWGFASKNKSFKTEIETIEHFYHSLNHKRIDIELCPFVGNELAIFLSQRGYQITELNNVSALDIQSYKSPAVIKDNKIKIITTDEKRLWAQQVAKGFGYPEAEEQFYYYIQAPGVHAFAVYDDKTIIAGGAIAIHGAVCDLGVTSTLPAYRGQGLQKKLLDARIQFAKEQGVTTAAVTTEPGSTSDLNVQKMGFYCAYTRVKLTREI